MTDNQKSLTGRTRFSRSTSIADKEPEEADGFALSALNINQYSTLRLFCIAHFLKIAYVKRLSSTKADYLSPAPKLPEFPNRIC